MLLFDIWVANGDRHDANLALDTSSNPATLSVFDHSHALLGREASGATARCDRLRDELAIAEGTDPSGNRHCLLDVIRSDSYFPKWLERIRLVPEYVLEDACRAAIGSGATADEAWAGIRFLKYRREKLRDIINAHRDRFAVPQWSVI